MKQAGWIRVGHRGAPREFPGNTLRGFQRAIELGCEMVECDIRETNDGVIVLAHDPVVKDSGGNIYSIADTDRATLASLDLGAGEGVPTLQDLVALANGRCAIMADMKCEGREIELRVSEALAPLGIDAKLIPGAGEVSRARFRQIDPLLPLSLTLSAQEAELLSGAGFERLLESLDTAAVTWEHPLLNEERIAALHFRGVRVFAWTVDDPSVMNRLITEGVDGIISNRPDLMTSQGSKSGRNGRAEW